jgi:16S rRNA (cytosine1402-N4)-methyltransferase
MDQNDEHITAETIVNNFSEEEISNIIAEFGQDRKAKKIARLIVRKRKENVITSTVQLANIVKEAVVGKGSWSYGQRHPAVRTFQALRIYINQELSELVDGLQAAERFLVPQARLSIVTFHSLEDRLVKRFFLPNSDENWKRKVQFEMRPEIDWNGLEYEKLENEGLDYKKQGNEELENERLENFDYSHLIPEVEEVLHTFKVLSRRVIKPSQMEVEGNQRARSAKLRIAERTQIPTQKTNFHTKYDYH